MARRREYERELPGPLKGLNIAADWFGRNVLQRVPGLGSEVEEAMRPGASLEEALEAAGLGSLLAGLGTAGGVAGAGALAGRGGLSALASEAGASTLPAGLGRGASRVLLGKPGSPLWRKAARAGAIGFAGKQGLAGLRQGLSDSPEVQSAGGPQDEFGTALGSDESITPDMIQQLLAAEDSQRAGTVQGLKGYGEQAAGDTRTLEGLLNAIKKGAPGRAAYGIWEDILGEREKEEKGRMKGLGSFADLIVDRAREGATPEQILPELDVMSQFSGVDSRSPELLGAFQQLFPQGQGSSIIAEESGPSDEDLASIRSDIRAAKSKGVPYQDAVRQITDAYVEGFGTRRYFDDEKNLRSLIDSEYGMM